MSQSASIGTMIKRIYGLHGTKDVSGWESQFIDSVVHQSDYGKDTTSLSAKQIEIIERIHNKHFAG